LLGVVLASVIFVSSIFQGTNNSRFFDSSENITLPPEQTQVISDARTNHSLCKGLVENYDDHAHMIKILSLAQIRDPFDNNFPLPSPHLEPLPRCVGQPVVQRGS